MAQYIMGAGMPKTRSREDVVKFLASELLPIMDYTPGTQKQKLQQAKRILGALLKVKTANFPKLDPRVQRFALKQAVGLMGQNGEQRNFPVVNDNVVEKSYTKSDAAPNADNIKLPEPSSYQSYSECVSDISGRFQLV